MTWQPDPREAYRELRNLWTETRSLKPIPCGSEKGYRTSHGCGEDIPAGELHDLMAPAWRGNVKSRVWAIHFHKHCTPEYIKTANDLFARQHQTIVLMCKTCGGFMGLRDGTPLVWLGRCGCEGV